MSRANMGTGFSGFKRFSKSQNPAVKITCGPDVVCVNNMDQVG